MYGNRIGWPCLPRNFGAGRTAVAKGLKIIKIVIMDIIVWPTCLKAKPSEIQASLPRASCDPHGRSPFLSAPQRKG